MELSPKKLGRNQGRYHGECIRIGEILTEFHAVAARCGWRFEPFFEFSGFRLCGYHRPTPNPRFRLYLSTGIHGDEPAGPIAALELIKRDKWREDVDIWFCPCINPTGFERNTRENASGQDLNRDYRHLETAEVRSHAAWLQKLPRFDLTVILHEDWEANGYYLYELNPSGLPSLAELIISEVSKVCPIEHAAKVDNWDAKDGIIRPGIPPEDRPKWAEALYLIAHKSQRSYTLEAPSDFPLPVRVQAHVAAVQTVLAAI